MLYLKTKHILKQNKLNHNKMKQTLIKSLFIKTWKRIKKYIQKIKQQLKHHIIFINIKYMLIFMRNVFFFFFFLHQLKLLNLPFLIGIITTNLHFSITNSFKSNIRKIITLFIYTSQQTLPLFFLYQFNPIISNLYTYYPI